jgi:uncharacterized protein with HEPN domain
MRVVSPEDRTFIGDILRSCEKVIRYSRGLSKEVFFADELKYDAVLRNLEIIGEAVKHLSSESRDRHPEIAWRKIAGLRDMVIHEYFGLDATILWDVITSEVPKLRAQADSILKEESPRI